MASQTTNYHLIKPAYSDTADVASINTNMDTIDTALNAHDSTDAALQDSIAIVATGNTHAAIGAGRFVYVKNHNTLSEGLYTNTSGSTIAANATLSSSNLTADSSGGLNALISNLAALKNGTPSILVSHTNTTAVDTAESFDSTINTLSFITFGAGDMYSGSTNEHRRKSGTEYVSFGTHVESSGVIFHMGYLIDWSSNKVTLKKNGLPSANWTSRIYIS